MGKHRDPYVGEGADGARRSAQIDREEADCYTLDDPRVGALIESAIAWEQQAADLDQQASVPGVRVRAVRFAPPRPGEYPHDDNTTVPPGTEGTVMHVDDTGTVFVDWDNGSRLGLLPGTDQWEILTNTEATS